MAHQFIPIADQSALEGLIERSQNGPVIIFKHSSTCPISSAAYQQMTRVACDVALVVVQRARALSREIETRTGIRHESPQTIILRNGQVVWAASHGSITSDAVTAAMRANA